MCISDFVFVFLVLYLYFWFCICMSDFVFVFLILYLYFWSCICISDFVFVEYNDVFVWVFCGCELWRRLRWRRHPSYSLHRWGRQGGREKIIENCFWVFLYFLVFQSFQSSHRWGGKIIQNLKLFLNFLVFQNKLELPHIRPPGREGKNNWKFVLEFS